MLGSTRWYFWRSILLCALAVLAAPLTCWAVTYAYFTDTDLIRSADRIVRGRVIRVHTEEGPGGALYTVASISVAEDHTGVPGTEIEVRELGGELGSRFLRVHGGSRYEVGSEVLVMLERTRGGRFRSIAMGLSKFDVIPSADGDPILLRDTREAIVLGGKPSVARTIRLSAFRQSVRQTRGMASWRRVGGDAPLTKQELSSLLRFDNGLGVRWTEADSGMPIRWYRDTTAPAPLTSGDGTVEIRLALSAWTRSSQGALELAYEGSTDQQPYGPWSGLGGSGAGVIFFEDPNDEISEFVLAVGGGGGTLNDGGTVNDTRFNRFTHGFVILQNAAQLSSAVRQSRDFTRVIQHEVGHAIGLGHTPVDGSVLNAQTNIMFPSCCTAATPIAPALGAHDLAILEFIYPAPVVPCSYSLSPATAGLSAAGGSVTTRVQTGNACEWSVIGVSSWLSLSGSQARSGPGDVSFVASANPLLENRTSQLTIAGRSYTVTQAAAPPSIPPPAGHDPRFDLLWHHQGDGSIAAWVMNGTTLVSGTLVARVADTNWKIAGTGDLDGDGYSDLVWQNIANGQLSAWLMRGQNVRETSPLSLPQVESTAWRIRAVGDLDGDGKADLLWQHENGTIAVWLMNGFQVRQGTTLNPSRVQDTAWQLVAIADFDRDGRRDLLWHHQEDGRIAVWLMNGLNQISGTVTNPGQVSDVDWKIRGATDLNGDGYPDIVWQNTVDGRLSGWRMRGLDLVEGTLLTPSQVADTNWRIAGTR
ncbi:MAG: VCBS repeat-containing protein [Acidobacteria bacterium]|nr:VCBS repeat-containing protein [Acidobacteriota bacterium]